MLLIIFLGLIAKIALVSGECTLGTPPVTDFDWTKFADSRNWYYKLHSSKEIENKIDCPVATYSSPEGGSSFITTDVYDTSKQLHIIEYGNATNLNSSGCYDLNYGKKLWTGRCCVISTDYVSYFLLKCCYANSNKPSVYVAYRKKKPDGETLKDVKNVMQDNNIDVSQLLEFSTDHCQEAESSTAGGSSTETPT